MLAAIRRTYDSPKSINIEHIDQPVPKDNEVLIKVYATTVNRTDCANLTARPFIMRFVLGLFKPKKIILGTDFAGKVLAIGNEVKTFQISDRVFGFNDLGLCSQAEYMVIPWNGNLMRIPKNIDYKMAAASLEGACYAYTFIHKVKIQTGQKILINGASGGIGSALLQFVRQYDVKIAATCGTKNIELIRSLGADKVYDYTREDFTESEEKYDFIYDAVGKSTFGKCKPLLKVGGVYISSELGPYAQNPFLAIFTKFIGTKKVIFPIPYGKESTFPFINNLLKKGKYKPVIDREYALADISKAYDFVMTGEKTGNVVIYF